MINQLSVRESVITVCERIVATWPRFLLLFCTSALLHSDIFLHVSSLVIYLMNATLGQKKQFCCMILCFFFLSVDDQSVCHILHPRLTFLQNVFLLTSITLITSAVGLITIFSSLLSTHVFQIFTECVYFL